MRAVAVLVSLLLAGPAWAQVDRSSPPPLGPPPEVRLPQIQKRALSNGLPVWLVEQHEVPIVQVDLIVKSGSATDPTGRYGLASFTAAMLDEGAGTRDSLGIADAIDYLGAELSTSSAIDASAVRLNVPVARLADALSIMADVALRPTFPAGEIERLRQERLTALQQGRDNPAEISRAAFPLVVFGPTHRYGTGGAGTLATVRGFSADDLHAFHATHYQPSNAGLLIVGDVRAADVLPLLEKAFGAWPTTTPAAKPSVSEPAPLRGRRVVIVDKPGAPQSQIRIGGVGVARSTPDYHAVQVLNTILGGSFTSRLNQNLREQHGYAYGAGSGFDMRQVSGLFVASAGVQSDKTAESVREFFRELTGILEPVPEDEIAKAKNYLALSYPLEFETSRAIAAQLAQAFVYDLPEDFFSGYVQRIQAITAADVQRVAKRYIQPDRFAIVIVGDRKTIEAPVRALKLGPVSFMSVEEAIR
jgi:zinc protease